MSTFCHFEDCDQTPTHCSLHVEQEAEMAAQEATAIAAIHGFGLITAMRAAIEKCHDYDPRPNAVIDILQAAIDAYEES